MGSVGRGDLRVQVADRRDWFGIEGGATVRTAGAKDAPTVPLSQLFAAIRDGHRYVTVGGRGFVRIEETLRAALARAEGVVFEHRGALQVSAVGSDALVGLVEHQTQLEASASFLALRARMKQSEAEQPRLSAAMAATLRPYQRDGVTWMGRLAHGGAGAILADEMGLGKTVQTLALLSHRAGVGPALVVAPTSVVPNWLSEAARFTPELTVRDLRGPARAALASGALVPAPGEVWMTSYAIATLEAEGLARHTFATLVIDEAQAVKNATTERAKALRDLDAGWRLALTGTPVENRLSELWSIFRIVSPGLFGSWEQFRARYAVPIEKFGDDARRRGLAALLRPFVLRRTKEEVARDLPPRTEVVRTVRLSTEERSLYEELRRATIEELAEAKKNPDRDASDMRFVLLAALTRLRQLCCHPRLVYPDTTAGSAKAAHLLELMAELREGGHKVLVFSQFRSLLDLLAPRLAQHGHRVLVLDGTTPADVRERRIAAFQAGEADAFLISLKAGGFGLNLTAADTVIHMDPWWNPAVEDQATARAHRIGQRKPVTAIRLVARDTIEEAVIELHAAKRALAAGVLEGSEVAAALDNQQLAALIERGFDHPG
jgi:SNF2 family DNA or RNA helicase